MSTTSQVQEIFSNVASRRVLQTEGEKKHEFPPQLSQDFKTPSKLSREQCGHIRHIHNLASQLDSDWAFMGAQEPGQEWDTAYRYQLAHMTYAVGAAHYHHLPAMRHTFKTLFEKLIKKMLLRDVWGYWYLSSQSGVRMDPDLKELRKPWVDPVCKENIMYSGHLFLMVSLYTMLFHDHRYDEKDGIVFDWNPIFFGMGPERYSYTRATLQEAILKEMERENWMGVCCEPNMIFIVCNQFPILAVRYNDSINGTHVVDDVLKKYKAAWAKEGMIGPNGLFRRNYYPNQKSFGVNDEVNHTVWAMAFMPWNYEFTKPMYPSMANGYLYKVGNRTNLNSAAVAYAMKDIVANDGVKFEDAGVIEKAREVAKKSPSKKLFQSPAFGHIAMWVSEYGEPTDLESLLRHADTYMNPSWANGGFYYRRNDVGWDEEGNYTYVDPNTGNGAIAYSRLNVKNGQKKMWDEPWTEEMVRYRPRIDGVDLAQGIDFVRGHWDENQKAMIATFRSLDRSRKSIKPVVKMLPAGTYGVYVDAKLERTATVSGSDNEIVVDLHVEGEDVDLVVLRA